MSVLRHMLFLWGFSSSVFVLPLPVIPFSHYVYFLSWSQIFLFPVSLLPYTAFWKRAPKFALFFKNIWLFFISMYFFFLVWWFPIPYILLVLSTMISYFSENILVQLCFVVPCLGSYLVCSSHGSLCCLLLDLFLSCSRLTVTYCRAACRLCPWWEMSVSADHFSEVIFFFLKRNFQGCTVTFYNVARW